MIAISLKKTIDLSVFRNSRSLFINLAMLPIVKIESRSPASNTILQDAMCLIIQNRAEKCHCFSRFPKYYN